MKSSIKIWDVPIFNLLGHHWALTILKNLWNFYITNQVISLQTVPRNWERPISSNMQLQTQTSELNIKWRINVDLANLKEGRLEPLKKRSQRESNPFCKTQFLNWVLKEHMNMKWFSQAIHISSGLP